MIFHKIDSDACRHLGGISLIIFVLALAGNPAFVYSAPSGYIDLYTVTYEKKTFTIAYGENNLSIDSIQARPLGLAISLTSSDKEGGFLELSVPYELFKLIWPEASGNPELDGLTVEVDARLEDTDITLIGNRVTVSVDVPASASTVVIEGSSLLVPVPMIIIDTPSKPYRLGDTAIITGSVKNAILAEKTLKIQLLDALGSLVTNQTSAINDDDTFESEIPIPRDARGGVYSISARVVSEGGRVLTGNEYLKITGPAVFSISTQGTTELFYVDSNSTSIDPFFMRKSNVLGFVISGDGSAARLRTIFPDPLLAGNLTLIGPEEAEFSTLNNSTHSIVDLVYEIKGTSFLAILGTSSIPEFPSALITVSAAIGTLLFAYRIRKNLSAGIRACKPF